MFHHHTDHYTVSLIFFFFEGIVEDKSCIFSSPPVHEFHMAPQKLVKLVI